ncbi:MAG TPA: hypothetical protein VEC12_12825 [Bacteroidia bacterium]|nr:hypothetical protein [Bacteroidia bacterium]
MNNNFLRLTAVIVTASLVTFASCKKKDDPKDPDPGPGVTLNIEKPTTSDMFGKDDTVFIKAHASWVNQFHGYELKLRNLSDGSKEVFKVEGHIHDKEVDIDTFWVNNVAAHSQMELEINMIKDHDGNKETKKVAFHCHPM